MKIVALCFLMVGISAQAAELPEEIVDIRGTIMRLTSQCELTGEGIFTEAGTIVIAGSIEAQRHIEFIQPGVAIGEYLQVNVFRPSNFLLFGSELDGSVDIVGSARVPLDHVSKGGLLQSIRVPYNGPGLNSS